MKKIRYNLDFIDKRGSQINLIWGERSNGKSYQLKHKKAINKILNDTVSYHYDYKTNEILENVVEKGSKFILMRRWKEEISPTLIEQYFNDVDVCKLTDDKYNMITMYRKRLYFSYYNIDTNKTTRGPLIGYVASLSTEQNYAGASFLDVTDIIFEEFMSRSEYLRNEPAKLMNFYCTVDRKRGTTRLWLVGNAISRVCPYLVDWGLKKVVDSQQQGDINDLYIKTGDKDEDDNDITVKISIEYCKSTGQSSYVIGSHKDMLNKGSWQTDIQPKLPHSINKYKKLLEIGFSYKSFKFIGRLIKDNLNNLCWFIYPTKRNFNNKMIVFSDIIKPTIYYQRDIYNPTFPNKNINEILKTFREDKIFYCSDLCGTDFKQCIDFLIRK